MPTLVLEQVCWDFPANPAAQTQGAKAEPSRSMSGSVRVQGRSLRCGPAWLLMGCASGQNMFEARSLAPVRRARTAASECLHAPASAS